jgi:S1-C subfamily serine protease
MASVLGVDLMADLAVLNTPEFDFPPVQLGSASEIDIGDRVTAMSIGSDRIAALSYGQIQERNALAVANDGSVLPGMLYTDLLSSGPLLDSSGAVVGFLTNSAPGNAIPIDDVRVIVAQIDTSGRPRHGWIGVQVRNDIGREGAIVVAVVAGAPSDQSGIQVGDRIISLGNDRVRSSADLLAAIAQRRAGDPVLVGLTRAGITQKLPVSLGEQPALSAQSGLRG